MASLSQGRTAAAQCGFFTYKSVPVIFELHKIVLNGLLQYTAVSATNSSHSPVTISKTKRVKVTVAGFDLTRNVMF